MTIEDASAMITQMTSPERRLRDVIEIVPVILHPKTPLEDAIARMNHADAHYILIAEQQRPLGIFTLRDLARLVAAGHPTAGVPLSAVMTTPLQTLSTTQTSKL